jgi:hypothetical protein
VSCPTQTRHPRTAQHDGHASWVLLLVLRLLLVVDVLLLQS